MLHVASFTPAILPMDRHEPLAQSYLIRFAAVLGLAVLFVLLMGLAIAIAPEDNPPNESATPPAVAPAD